MTRAEACQELRDLADAQWAALYEFNDSPGNVTAAALADARRDLDAACEAFRRRWCPRSREVYVALAMVIAVSPTGRRREIEPVIAHPWL